MDEIQESWMHKVRSLAPVIEQAEYDLHESEADVKRLQAGLKQEAMGNEKYKTVSAQEVYAETNDDLYKARLKVGVCKGTLSALRVQLRSVEVGFEQWRTECANTRTEQKRYGA